jgi:hypothetical protein
MQIFVKPSFHISQFIGDAQLSSIMTMAIGV